MIWMMKTIVFSTFPACGIDSLCDNHNGDPYIMLNLDYNRFKCNGNSKFPKNYIDCVERNIGKVDFIFVSSHNDVRKELKKKEIKYFSIYPSINLKDMWIHRMKLMGYDKALINKIQRNFDQLIFKLQSENSPLVYKYQLTERIPTVTIDILNFVSSDENSFVTNFHNKLLV